MPPLSTTARTSPYSTDYSCAARLEARSVLEAKIEGIPEGSATIIDHSTHLAVGSVAGLHALFESHGYTRAMALEGLTCWWKTEGRLVRGATLALSVSLFFCGYAPSSTNSASSTGNVLSVPIFIGSSSCTR